MSKDKKSNDSLVGLLIGVAVAIAGTIEGKIESNIKERKRRSKIAEYERAKEESLFRQISNKKDNK